MLQAPCSDIAAGDNGPAPAVRNQKSKIKDSPIKLPDIEPWPEPILDIADILCQVSARYSLYAVLPEGAADAKALWTAHTHAVQAFHQSPRLNLQSIKSGAGKTTCLDVLATMTPRPLRTENLRAAVLFRLVDQCQPTLLLDEVDTYLPQSEELRGLINAGHKRGSCAYRCEGEGNAVRSFKAYAPAVLAGIGPLPATIHDRSIVIPLLPAEDGAIAQRFDPLHVETEITLARKLARWAKDNFHALSTCKPTLPPGAFNRLADNWRPLLAIAQLAGGGWPARALNAFTKLTPKSRSEADLSQMLLSDIRTIFAQAATDRLFTRAIIDSLCALPQRPWTQLPCSNHGSVYLNEHRLARHLAAFGVRSQTLRIGHHRAKGYSLLDLTPAFSRILDTK